MDIFNNVDKDEVDIDSDDFQLEELQDLAEFSKKPKKAGEFSSSKGTGIHGGPKFSKIQKGSFLAGLRKGSSNSSNNRFGRPDRGSTFQMIGGRFNEAGSEANSRPSQPQIPANFSIMEIKEKPPTDREFEGIGYSESSPVVGSTTKNLRPAGVFAEDASSPTVQGFGTFNDVVNQDIDSHELQKIREHQSAVAAHSEQMHH